MPRAPRSRLSDRWTLAVKRVTEARRRLERVQAAVDTAEAELEEVERERVERESELGDARVVVAELREK